MKQLIILTGKDKYAVAFQLFHDFQYLNELRGKEKGLVEWITQTDYDDPTCGIEWCQEAIAEAMEDECTHILVSIDLPVEEQKLYAAMAAAFGYNVQCVNFPAGE